MNEEVTTSVAVMTEPVFSRGEKGCERGVREIRCQKSVGE